jgi:hypothetical protein
MKWFLLFCSMTSFNLLADLKIAEGDACSNYRENAIYWEITSKTVQYFSDNGIKRTVKGVRLFLDSAWRVAKMDDNFPSENFDIRWTQLFGYGGKESGYIPNYVHVNIPGVKYDCLPKGKSVKKESIDWGWTGLNDDNVEWTYILAKSIQDGIPVSADFRTKYQISQTTQDELRATLHIPKRLKLKKIDLSISKQVKKSWERQVKKGVAPSKIRVSVPYRESTPDDKDSMLIYRIMVEVARKNVHWNYKTWDNDIYSICESVVKKYPNNLAFGPQ